MEQMRNSRIFANSICVNWRNPRQSFSISVSIRVHPWFIYFVDTLKFKSPIAYDGTAYQGWQVQKIGTGVQEKIEAAFGQMFPSVKRIHSSSRTDTGVHALGMVAHVEIPRAEFKMPIARLALALNAFLPDDIRVLSAVRVPKKFHARFDAKGKQYRYFVWNHATMNPLLRNRAWHFPMKLDLAKMRAAAKLFLGKHDFK